MQVWNIRRVASSIVIGVLCFCLGFGLRHLIIQSETPGPLLSGLSDIVEPPPPNPYPAYSFSALEKTAFRSQPITVLEVLASDPAFTSYLVRWDVPDLVEGKALQVTGQLNVPSGSGPFPIIVMNRGYVEREEYETGIGTRNGAAVFARNGYITIAPDFMGYGGSSPEPEDGLLARFQRPVTVLQLLKNLENLTLLTDIAQPIQVEVEEEEEENTRPPVQVNRALFATDRIGMWGHSNGGQIALSVLEITNRRLPTTLWAPVSKPFPYSILYYTDESPDGGKYLRQQLAWFEGELDNSVAEYSILNQPERIVGPLQVHQGGADDAIPLEWSQELVSMLEAGSPEIQIELFTYPNADHNLQPDWNTVIQRDLEFFADELKSN